MWIRAAHAELDIPKLQEFIRKNPLGLFITGIPESVSGVSPLQATHIPWLLDEATTSDPSDLGRLRGHMARANPQSKALVEAARQEREKTGTGADGKPVVLEQDVLIIFNGPVQSYVTTKYYTETKPRTAKVAPTWNYTAVQVYGKARIYLDGSSPTTGGFLQKQLEELSAYGEEEVMGYVRKSEASAEPQDERLTAWEVADAPEKFIQMLKKAIIGVEIDIGRMEGKFKMSQEMGAGDRQGVVDGFKARGTKEGDEIARMVEERGTKAKKGPQIDFEIPA